MSDLSNLLGDVYGDHSPDAPPVRRELSANQRISDGPEDLSAALAAALATPAPAPAPAPLSMPVEDVPMPTLAQALAEVPAAPKAAWTSSAAPAPAAPSMVSAPASGGFWMPGDDDIFPMPRGAKKSKK